VGVDVQRACLFPLSTNAGFYRARGQLNLQRRVKEAALLYNRVILEDGLYSATVGPRGAVEMHEPVATDENILRARSLKPRGGTFLFALGHKTGRGVVVNGPAERRFVAECRSVVQELLEDTEMATPPDWVQVRTFDLPPVMNNQVQRLARADARRPGFWKRTGSSFLRDLVLKSLNHDLVLSACMGAFASLDSYFAPLLRRKPELKAARGHFALRVLVPNFSSLDWPQIMDVRDQPGIADFRAKLAEIEEEALNQVDGAVPLSEAVLRRTLIDLAQKWRPPSGLDVTGSIAVDLAVGSIPLLGPGVSALLDVAQADQARHTWGAVFLRLLELTGRP
jgi:hypothetical protein